MSKVILVTGGNAGIGLALVRLLAEKNHTVYIGSRNEAAGKKEQEILNAEGYKSVKSVQLDVTQLPSISAAKETIERAEGKLDVLVNNAAIAQLEKPQKADSVELSALRDVMETNFFGLVQTTKAFLPLLCKSTQGVILNVSSDMASNSHMTKPETSELHFVAYNTSKAAMNSYTLALAHELKKDGIKVNMVTPGFTATKLNYYAPGGGTTKQGAEVLLPYALLNKDGPSGGFFNVDGEFPW